MSLQIKLYGSYPLYGNEIIAIFHNKQAILSYPLYGNEIIYFILHKNAPFLSYPLYGNEILSIGSLGNSIVSYPLYGNEIICPWTTKIKITKKLSLIWEWNCSKSQKIIRIDIELSLIWEWICGLNFIKDTYYKVIPYMGMKFLKLWCFSNRQCNIPLWKWIIFFEIILCGV